MWGREERAAGRSVVHGLLLAGVLDGVGGGGRGLGRSMAPRRFRTPRRPWRRSCLPLARVAGIAAPPCSVLAVRVAEDALSMPARGPAPWGGLHMTTADSPPRWGRGAAGPAQDADHCHVIGPRGTAPVAAPWLSLARTEGGFPGCVALPGRHREVWPAGNSGVARLLRRQSSRNPLCGTGTFGPFGPSRIQVKGKIPRPQHEREG